MSERIWFADMEAYSLEYYKLHNDIKGYAFIQKDLEGHYIFDVDIDNYIDKMFSQEGSKHTIIWHNGGGYDWRFFLSNLQKRADSLRSHNFKYFAKDKKLFYMTYSIKTEVLIRDEDNKLIWTGKRAKNGNKKYKRRKITKTFTFLDSYKHWPFSLADIGKAVGLEKLDYGEYDITKEFHTNQDYKNWQDGKAYEYLHRDVDIPIKFYKETKHIYDIVNTYTLASTAFKDMCSYNENLKFSRRWLKDVQVWAHIKTGFVGGFTWVNPIYQLTEVNNIYKYDVNSLYPYIMRDYPLPFGSPITEETEIKDRLRYYQVAFTRAKAKTIPFLSRGKKEKEFENVKAQLFDIEWETFSDLEEEYPKELYNQVRVMSSTLLEFFKQHYEIDDLKTNFLYEFKTRYGMFSEYIDKWTELKVNNDDKPAIRLIAKLFQNTTFGRFAMGVDFNKGIITKEETIKEWGEELKETEKQLWFRGSTATRLNDGYIFWKERQEIKSYEIKNEKGNKEMIDDVSYIPIAEQITTLARIKLLEPVIDKPEVLVYSDTDSLHTTIPMEEYLDIHQTRLGAWKYEGTVGTGIYRRPKHYLNLDIDENGKKTDYLLKGGGFNVNEFNTTKTIDKDTYLQETFTIKNGKMGKREAFGKPIIIGMDYTFTMPKWYKEKWQDLD